MPEFENILAKALYEFNRIRVPEVEANLKEVTEEGFKVLFTGSFCQTCGYYDYFEDLLYLLLDDYGVETKIEDIQQYEDGDYVNYLLGKK